MSKTTVRPLDAVEERIGYQFRNRKACSAR